MRIVLIGGGLGNQLFQYIFFRYGQRCCPEETWYLDDSEFFANPMHNGYELEKIWGIQANLLSRYFDEDVWEEIIRLRKARGGASLPAIFSDMGIPLTMVAETNDFSYQGKVLRTPTNQFHPEIMQIPEKNIYYHGYWINKNWFTQYREENLVELAFPELTDPQNLRYADIIRDCLSVGVHIRRGDFVTVGLALPTEYYQQSCRQVLNAHPESRFFVFSDDVDWCKANEKALGLDLAPRTVYVTGNDHGKNYIDAQLMSMCKGLIRGCSTTQKPLGDKHFRAKYDIIGAKEMAKTSGKACT